MDAYLFLLFAFPIFTVCLPNTILRARTPHITHTGAYPNSVNVTSATHYIEIDVAGQSLTQLLIELPHCLNISNINVTNQNFKRVEHTISLENGKVIICFTQPIPAETTLIVSMQGVRYLERLARVWFYPIYAKETATTPVILVGIAQVQTYKQVHHESS